MNFLRSWYLLSLRFVRNLWIKLGWRKVALFGVALVSLLVLGFVVLSGNNESPTLAKSDEKTSQVAEASDVSQAPVTTDAVSPTTDPNAPHPATTAPATAPKPKSQTQTPAGASLIFSANEISVHAGWESSNYTASISNGAEFSGLSKEWNDNSPVSVGMPLGTKQGKTLSFFVSTPITTTPGTYTVKVRASGGSESYTANLKVRVLPPLVAFDTITYDDYLEGYIIALKLHDNFTGDPVVQLTASPNGTPCAYSYFFIDQIDDETFTFECTYGLDRTGSFPLTFSVTGAGKTFTKSITWIR